LTIGMLFRGKEQGIGKFIHQQIGEKSDSI
jgi:hypothetical protein